MEPPKYIEESRLVTLAFTVGGAILFLPMMAYCLTVLGYGWLRSKVEK